MLHLEFSRLPIFLRGLRAASRCLFDIFQEIADIAGDDASFIEELWLFDDHFVDHNVIVQQRHRFDLEVNFSEVERVLIAPTFRISYGESGESARSRQW